MDLTWNLDTLDTSFTLEKFKCDMKLLNQHIVNLNQWAKKNIKDSSRATFKIEEFLKFYNEYKSLYSCLFLYSYLVLSADSSNVEARELIMQRLTHVKAYHKHQQHV